MIGVDINDVVVEKHGQCKSADAKQTIQSLKDSFRSVCCIFLTLSQLPSSLIAHFSFFSYWLGTAVHIPLQMPYLFTTVVLETL